MELRQSRGRNRHISNPRASHYRHVRHACSEAKRGI